MPLQDVARISATPGFVMAEEPSLRVVFLGFNWRPNQVIASDKANPLQDVRVRKALWHAIDLEAIRDQILRGKSRIIGTVVAPPVPGYSADNDKPLAYDPELAKSLLAEAGYPDGFSVSFGCPNDQYVGGEQICIAITSMWSRIGVQAQLTTESASTYAPRMDAGEFDIFMSSSATLPSIDGRHAPVQPDHA